MAQLKIRFVLICTHRTDWVCAKHLALRGVYVPHTIHKQMDWWRESMAQFRGNQQSMSLKKLDHLYIQ